MVRQQPPEDKMIRRLDSALRELTEYRAELEPMQWRTDVVSRMATIDNIVTLIRQIYPTMEPIDGQKNSA